MSVQPRPPVQIQETSKSVVSPGAFKGTAISPRLLKKVEKLLIAGDSISGKTYAYLRKAQKLFVEHMDKDTKAPNFWVMDTNNALPAYLNDGGEFDFLYYENGGNVYPFPCSTFIEAVGSAAYIQQNARDGDWIVLDLANQLYDFAQSRVALQMGKDLAQETYDRNTPGQKKDGFGAFDGSDWQAVKVIFQNIMNGLYYKKGTNMILVTHLVEIVDAPDRNKSIALMLFDAFGYKPQGPAYLYTQPETVMLLWGKREINRQGNKRVGTAMTRRFVNIVKDRGQPTSYQTQFDQDVFDILDEFRAEMLKARIAGRTFNITTPEPEGGEEEAPAEPIDIRTDTEDPPTDG